MSIIDSIVSDIGSALSDPGKLVTDTLDAILPDQLKSVGDVAGGLLDLVIGKESQAVSLFKDGIKDLPQPKSSSKSTSADPATEVATATEAATAAAEPSPPPSATSNDTSTPSDVSALLAMSSDDFMKAVSSGDVPADVAGDPTAMLQIQSRVNEIAQMNQLVTSMLSATHQMQMSIAQNIRA
ncbi:MAG TPA: hypothetical protein VMT03_12055 [Polyangia bacterium]|nr:hypothetical protein [Polyangia bacterium]